MLKTKTSFASRTKIQHRFAVSVFTQILLRFSLAKQ